MVGGGRRWNVPRPSSVNHRSNGRRHSSVLRRWVEPRRWIVTRRLVVHGPMMAGARNALAPDGPTTA